MSTTYAHEKAVAIAAVVRACRLTSAAFNKLVKNETLTKGDKSPVTAADYSTQAVVNTILSNALPNDPIMGEEDANDLRDASKEKTKTLRDRIAILASETLAVAPAPWEQADWGVGKSKTIDELLDIIDLGNNPGGKTGRFWTLDPIDGTKGFLRGEQFAVCLALIVDGIVQIGVIGCPNLPSAPDVSPASLGSIFIAVRGQGAEEMPIPPESATELPAARALKMPEGEVKIEDVRTLESVESGHSGQGLTGAIAKELGLVAEPNRMDSQAKYCVLSRGSSEGHIYLRMPVPGLGYIEKIWDHAAGQVLIEEAGGAVSDGEGAPLDFGLGTTLGPNKGIVACAKGIHSKVISAVKHARKLEAEGKL